MSRPLAARDDALRITAGSRRLFFVRALPALVTLGGACGVFAFAPRSLPWGLALAIAAAGLVMTPGRPNHWRSHLLDEARYQDDFLRMRRGSNVLVVPLRYIDGINIEGGFPFPLYLRLWINGPCSLGSRITIVPREWPGDSYSRNIVQEELIERVRRARIPLMPNPPVPIPEDSRA